VHLFLLQGDAGAASTPQTYYVSQSGGNDTNDGLSPATPWKTLAKVNGWLFNPGDQVLLNRGDKWRELLNFPSSGAVGNPITIGAYGTGSVPVVSGADQITGWSVFSGTTYQKALTTQPTLVVVNDSTWATLGSGSGTLNNGEWFWAANVLYYRSDAGNPDALGTIIEAWQRTQAALINARTNITIQEIQFEKSNGRCLRTANSADNVLIQNCVVRLSGVSDGSGAIAIGASSNPTVINNTITNPRNDGIYCFNVVNPTITGNVITTPFGPGSDGIHVDGTTGGLIANNSIDMTGTDSPKGCIILTNQPNLSANCTIASNFCKAGNYGTAINGSGHLVQFNLCLNQGVASGATFAAGLYVADVTASDNLTFFRNIIVGSQNGVYLVNAFDRTNMKFYHNTILSPVRFGFFADTGAALSGEFRNNIVWTPGATNRAYAVVTLKAGQTWVSNNNIIGPEFTGAYFYTGTAYNTLALYQAGTSQDANSSKNDPLIINQAGGNYGLQSGSPARETGAVIAGINDGTGGSARFSGAAPDMGAIESTGGFLILGSSGCHD